ncbi:hypothetical protein MJT46_007514, partial [Ovis ammon polii x Ovis aries]
NDLLMVCRQLNMEESVAEIMNQLGADENGKISFQDFTRCRIQLIREIRKEEVGLSEKSDNSWKKKKLRDRIASWPMSSDNSLGALSAARESWEYYSGARDLQSPDLQSQPALQKILEYGGSSLHQQAAVLRKLLAQSPHFGNSIGGSYLELANTSFPRNVPRDGRPTMSAKEKSKFEDMAKSDKARYDREMKTYVPPKGDKKGKKKDPNAPKRPPSAFFLFCSEHRPKIKSEHPGLSIGDTAKKLGEMWSEQSAKDKQPYEQKAAKLKEKYEKDIAAYRAKGKSEAGKKGPGRPTGSKKKNEPEEEEEEDEEEEEEEEDEE